MQLQLDGLEWFGGIFVMKGKIHLFQQLCGMEGLWKKTPIVSEDPFERYEMETRKCRTSYIIKSWNSYVCIKNLKGFNTITTLASQVKSTINLPFLSCPLKDWVPKNQHLRLTNKKMDKDQLHPRKITWNLENYIFKKGKYGKSPSKAPFLDSILLFGGLVARQNKSTAKIQFMGTSHNYHGLPWYSHVTIMGES